MKIALALFVIVGVLPLVAAGPESESTYIPPKIDKCRASKIAMGAAITTDLQPFYLRGDFDGDRISDYAVAVRGPRTKRNGVLICSGNGRVFLLGADQPLAPPFSDMPNDNFVGPNWEVLSVAETRELGRWTVNVPHPLPKILAETIAFVWEDGIALIYWNGQRFKWAGPKEP
jgi:hypothetical protein